MLVLNCPLLAFLCFRGLEGENRSNSETVLAPPMLVGLRADLMRASSQLEYDVTTKITTQLDHTRDNNACVVVILVAESYSS